MGFDIQNEWSLTADCLLDISIHGLCTCIRQNMSHMDKYLREIIRAVDGRRERGRNHVSQKLTGFFPPLSVDNFCTTTCRQLLNMPLVSRTCTFTVTVSGEQHTSSVHLFVDKASLPVSAEKMIVQTGAENKKSSACQVKPSLVCDARISVVT